MSDGFIAVFGMGWLMGVISTLILIGIFMGKGENDDSGADEEVL